MNILILGAAIEDQPLPKIDEEFIEGGRQEN